MGIYYYCVFCHHALALWDRQTGFPGPPLDTPISCALPPGPPREPQRTLHVPPGPPRMLPRAHKHVWALPKSVRSTIKKPWKYAHLASKEHEKRTLGIFVRVLGPPKPSLFRAHALRSPPLAPKGPSQGEKKENKMKKVRKTKNEMEKTNKNTKR